MRFPAALFPVVAAVAGKYFLNILQPPRNKVLIQGDEPG
jgi:hypothetical protein